MAKVLVNFNKYFCFSSSLDIVNLFLLFSFSKIFLYKFISVSSKLIASELIKHSLIIIISVKMVNLSLFSIKNKKYFFKFFKNNQNYKFLNIFFYLNLLHKLQIFFHFYPIYNQHSFLYAFSNAHLL